MDKRSARAALTQLAARKRAILALDEPEIRRLTAGMRVPQSHAGFWGGVHKARAMMLEATPDQRRESRTWLISHGLSVPRFNGLP